MVHVRLTRHLIRFFPGLPEHHDMNVASVAEVVTLLDASWPGLGDYLVDEHGSLRKHVNIFVNSDRVSDRKKLSDALHDTDSVHILQALSGG